LQIASEFGTPIDRIFINGQPTTALAFDKL